MKNYFKSIFIKKACSETGIKKLYVEKLDDPQLKKQALWGLGSSIKKLLENNASEDARDALDVLLERLELATTDGEIATILRALGTTGHPAIYAPVKKYLKSSFEFTTGNSPMFQALSLSFRCSVQKCCPSIHM